MKGVMRLLLLILLIPLNAYADCEWDGGERVKNCPEDAKLFLEKIAVCTHFAGEHTGNASPDRDKEVNAAIGKLQCNDVEDGANFRRLAEKYKSSSDYLIYDGILDTLNRIDPEFILNTCECLEN